MTYDVAIVGGGVMGCSAALFLARGGMRVALIDRGPLAREASGVNAGTLTLNMTRAALIPYAMRGWEMWTSARAWLGHDVGVVATHGLTLAFTAAEEELLRQRAAARQQQGAPIEVIDSAQARRIEPGLSERVRLAAHCPIDGHATAYLTGRAFHAALTAAGVDILENTRANGIDDASGAYTLLTESAPIAATRIVLAGGVWLEEMLAWLGVDIPVKVLINQLIVTERMPPVMQTVLSIANGLLSLKQFANGTVLIGGGWQGIGDRERGGVEAVPENLIGNARLAQWVIPALAKARMVRIWLGLESEVADAMPLLGPIPGHADAWVIGTVHSGYTSGTFMGKLLAQAILGDAPELPLFPPDRLLNKAGAIAA
jgi:sarcosine oxidase subunit beta